MKYYSVGLDLGGTKLAAALVDDEGLIISFQKESILDLKTDVKLGPQKIVRAMVDIVENFKRRYPDCFKAKCFRGVGLASAGPLNVERGELIYPVNFPGWKIVKIKDMLQLELAKRKITKTVEFQNDAIAAALAEGWIGGAKGLRSFAVVTIGTGIGSGVIFQGKPLQHAGMGSEFGHIIADNSRIKSAQDLKNYTIEGIASGTGILRRAKGELKMEVDSVEDIVDRPEAQPLFDDAADTLAALCYNLSVGFHLERILFSGGLIKVRHLYWNRMRTRYKLLIDEFNPAFRCNLSVAKCLNQAGVLGAAHLPQNRKKLR